MTDRVLLSAHLAGDPDAFRQLVARHIDLIHAAALRQAPDYADDITQAVLILLTQKASSLRHRPSIAGWLFTTTRLCASHARRAAQRRRTHEREAAMQNPAPQPSDHVAMLPLLDNALAALPSAERDLILQHHLQRRPLAELAADLHISIPAATKRTQRALERLRQWFTRHGDDTSAPALTALLLSQSAHHAPSLLATAKASASAVALAKAVGHWLLFTPAKIAAAITLLTLLTTGGIVLTVNRPTSPTAPRPLTPTQGAATRLALTTATSTPIGNAEAALPGRTRIALLDAVVDTAAADELRKRCAPVDTPSRFYAGYRANTDDVLSSLRDAKSAQQLQLPTGSSTAAAAQGVNPANIIFGQLNPGESLPVIFRSTYDLGGDGQLTVFGNSVFGSGATGPNISSRTTSSFTRDADALRLKFDLPNAVAGAHAGEIQFDGRLAPGETLLYVADLAAPQANGNPIATASPITHIVLWQAFKATDDQIQSIAHIRSAATWLRYGPEGARSLADRALVWQHHTPVAVFPASFSKVLPNGATVRLAAIGSPWQYPFLWWRPDGTPCDADWTGQDRVNTETALAIVVQVDAPEMITADRPGWFSYAPTRQPASQTDGPRYYRSPHAQSVWVVSGDSARTSVGVAVGQWTDLGKMEGPGELRKGDITVVFKSARQQIAGLQRGGTTPQSVRIPTLVSLEYTSPPQSELRMLAVDKAGKHYDTANADAEIGFPSITLGMPPADTPQYLAPIFVASDIDHYVVQTRHRDWTEFTGFATEPSGPVPDTVDPAEVAATRQHVERDHQADEAAKRAARLALLQHPDPSTPAGAAAAILVRARAGDVAGVRELYATKTSAEAAYADALARIMVAHETLRLDAERRFGRAAVADKLFSTLNSMEQLLHDYENTLDAKWQIVGDVAISSSGSYSRKLRINGIWLSAPIGDVSTLNLPVETAYEVRSAARLESIKSRLDAGEFATLDALAEALRSPPPAATQPTTR